MKNKLLTPARAFFLVLAALTVLLNFLKGKNGFGEWYATHIYAVLENVFARISGIFPFSLVEILLYVLILAALIWLVRVIVHRGPGKSLRQAGTFAIRLIIFLAFSYTACCGVNYYRDSFSTEENLQTVSHTVEDLKGLCEELSVQLNEVSSRIETDANGCSVMPEGTAQAAVESMNKLAQKYPSLAGYYPRPKLLIISRILSVQQVSGVYSPFTIEANVNGEMTSYNIPMTMCHELSHLKGFMREDEANFIGTLACMESDNTYFKYSGLMMASLYCMNQLYKEDYSAWAAIDQTRTAVVRADYSANTTFWEQFEGAISDAQTSINDQYLKSNGQSAGVATYDHVTELLLAWYLTDGFGR